MNNEYDVSKAFQRIEEILIKSMKRKIHTLWKQRKIREQTKREEPTSTA